MAAIPYNDGRTQIAGTRLAAEVRRFRETSYLVSLATMWFSERKPSDTPAYTRKLPSGGYIAIATQPVQTLFGPAKVRGHVVVERRSEERRIGHAPPIVAVAEHEDVNAVIAALVKVAESDEILETTLARRVTAQIRKQV